MPHRSTSRAAGLARWVRGARLPLRLVFLLTGSALALSIGSLDIAAVTVLWDADPVLLNRALAVVVVLVPPTLLGLLPQLRPVEGVAAGSLLGVDFGGHSPGLTRSWEQRWRAVTWFWAHLLSGAFTGVVVVVGAISVVALVTAPFAKEPGEEVLGLAGLTVDGSWQDAGLVVLGLVVAVVGALLLLLASEALVFVAPMLLGPSVPELLAELESRTSHLVERSRIARELHDSVGHALSVVVLQTAAARRRMTGDTFDTDDRERADTSLGVVEEVARRALEDLDGVLGLLREDVAVARDRPAHDLGSLDGLVRASLEGGHQVQLDAPASAVSGFPGVVSREAYRIVQESLTNALRHAPDQPVLVRLERVRDGLRIRVTNPLTGPATAVDTTGGGRGIAGIRERVKVFGGTVRVGPRDGTWQLDVRLPLPTYEKETP